MMGTEGRDTHRTARSGAALALMLASALLVACAVGPDYRPPTVGTTPVFKEIGDWRGQGRALQNAKQVLVHGCCGSRRPG